MNISQLPKELVTELYKFLKNHYYVLFEPPFPSNGWKLKGSWDNWQEEIV